jgi:hypothetical protein
VLRRSFFDLKIDRDRERERERDLTIWMVVRVSWLSEPDEFDSDFDWDSFSLLKPFSLTWSSYLESNSLSCQN